VTEGAGKTISFSLGGVIFVNPPFLRAKKGRGMAGNQASSKEARTRSRRVAYFRRVVLVGGASARSRLACKGRWGDLAQVGLFSSNGKRAQRVVRPRGPRPGPGRGPWHHGGQNGAKAPRPPAEVGMGAQGSKKKNRSGGGTFPKRRPGMFPSGPRGFTHGPSRRQTPRVGRNGLGGLGRKRTKKAVMPFPSFFRGAKARFSQGKARGGQEIFFFPAPGRRGFFFFGGGGLF